MKAGKPVILPILIVLWFSTPLAAAHYNLTTIDVPGYSDTMLFGINDAGQISGSCGSNSQNIWHGVIYTGGQFTTFDVPDTDGETQAYGIDANGRIVGYYSISGMVNQGFQYDQGTFTYPLCYPGVSNTFAMGINSKSQIVGYCWGYTVGFLYANGGYQALIAPGAQVTLACGINDAEEILGYYRLPLSATQRGFILSNGQYTTLDYPQAAGTILYGKNSAGLMVGARRDNNSKWHGFLYDGLAFTDLEPAGATQSWARAITSQGQIIGCYIDQNNISHGFLATPRRGLNAVYQLLLLD